MKKIFTAALALAATLPVFANLNTMNYQAVINGSDGTPMKNQEIAMTFTIKNAGQEVFTESATVKSNDFGMVSHEIGSKNDEFADINWGLGDYTLEVAIDLGTGSTSVYTSTIQSVPTALYSINGAEALEVANSAIWRAAQTADQFEAFQAQVEENVLTKEEAEEIWLANEQTNENMTMMMNALKAEMEETYATNEDVDAFATMVETRFDKIQNQVDGYDEAIENLEDLTGEQGRIMTLIKQLQNDNGLNLESIDNLEELTGEQGRIMTLIKELQTKNVETGDAIENLEELTGENGRIMTAIKTIENKTANMATTTDLDNLGENLDNMVKEFEETYANKEEVDAFATMVENRFDKMQTELSAATSGVEEVFMANEETRVMMTQMKNSMEAEMEETYATNEAVEAFSARLQANLDKMQTQADETDKALEAVKEELTNVGFTANKAAADLEQFQKEVEAGLEDYATNEAVEAFSARLQANLDKLQTQADETDKDLEAVKVDVFNAQTVASKAAADLEQFQKEVEVGLEAYAKQEEVDAFATMVETRFDKLQKQIDDNYDLQGDAIANLEELTGENGRIMTLIKELQNQIAKLHPADDVTE